jgi:ABC-type polysaccharide/polyol phosphate export permease
MLQVFFRDTKFLVSFVLQVFFFLTPIFYPASFVPENFRWLIRVNLFYYLIAPFRTLILDFDLFEFVYECLAASGICVGLGLLAFLYWKKYRNALYFNV